MEEIKAGDVVEWTSQAQGSSKTKRGKVLQIVLTGESIHPSWFSRFKTRIKFDKGSRTFERVLVEVPRGGKIEISDLYCPRLSAVTKVVDGGQ